MPDIRSTHPQALAAIDIGSNSFRLEIGHLRGGRYRRLEYLKRVVRLGADLDEARRLRESGAQRGLACLAEFAEHLRGLPGVRLRAVATQTLREAVNRDEFLQRANSVLGHPIEVISGREEARLIFAGVSCLQPSDQPRLVIDIGGRSTELILGQGRSPGPAESFPVGCVSLSMAHFPDGRLTADAFRHAQVAAGAQFDESLATFDRRHWREALGSSGTVGALSDVLQANGLTDGRITPQALAHLIELAIEAGHIDRLSLAGMKDDRRPVFAGGLAILYTLMALLHIDVLQPAKGALRQGVIVDLHDRLVAAERDRSRDLRDTTARQLQQRFGIDRQHADRVKQTALSLHDDIALTDAPDARRELGWVCDLHEIGMALSHHDHHRHSAYMLAHIDAPGFSQSQLRRLADLALAQRGGLRKVEALLGDSDSAWLVLCLRLAIIRCHARQDPSAPHWVLGRRGANRAWLATKPARTPVDPRTLYLLREEAQAWSKSGQLELEVPA